MGKSLTANDLAFVDTGALLDELRRRYPVMVFSGLKDARDPSMTERCFRWHGCSFGALGLLDYSHRLIMRRIYETTTNVDAEE
jgi:hypothetical protein